MALRMTENGRNKLLSQINSEVLGQIGAYCDRLGLLLDCETCETLASICKDINNMEYLFDGICLQNGRETNMDSLLLTSRVICGAPSMFAVVCDGVGSLKDGAYASMESVRLLNEWFSEAADTKRAGLRLRDEVYSINAKIVTDAKEKGVRTATTLSALLLVGRQYYIVHAGDSRIYSVDSAGLQPLTVDSVTETGKLTAAIGYRENMELYYAEGFANSDVFVVCSDGLYKRIDDEDLFTNIDANNRKSLWKSLNALSNFAIQQGERDNISIAIVKIVASG